MNPQFLQSFLQYIQDSTSNLSNSLQGVFESDNLQYDVVYERFLNLMETFKINMMKQMKQQVFQFNGNKSSEKDCLLLYKMKNLINAKIRK